MKKENCLEVKKILPSTFFDRSVVQVARELLGKTLMIRQPSLNGKKQSVIERLTINETEAYDGKCDEACHAFIGKTERNKVMFDEAGLIYVYLVYGMYWMFNVVTGAKNYGAAVLIRGAGSWNGPGKLTKNLFIDKYYYGLPLTQETGIWIEDAKSIKDANIKTTARIGLNCKSQEWQEMPWRFVLI